MTTCVVCGLSNMGLLKNDTASVLTVVDDLYQYSVFNMFDFFLLNKIARIMWNFIPMLLIHYIDWD